MVTLFGTLCVPAVPGAATVNGKLRDGPDGEVMSVMVTPVASAAAVALPAHRSSNHVLRDAAKTAMLVGFGPADVVANRVLWHSTPAHKKSRVTFAPTGSGTNDIDLQSFLSSCTRRY
jgi:hypothetical protein